MDTPQPPPRLAGEPVSPLLINWVQSLSELSVPDKEAVEVLIKERCEYGLKKYGQGLMTNDGRDDVVDAMQEMGDLLQYAYKAQLNGRLPELKKALYPVLMALFVLMKTPVKDVDK